MLTNPPKWLDDLCAEFEDHWTRNAPRISERILHFLNPLALPQEEHAMAFLALAEIDLDRDWLWWRKWLKADGNARPAKDQLATLASIARLATCLDAARAAGVEEFGLRHLAQVECRARVNWGDNPHRHECVALEGVALDWPLSRHFVSIYANDALISRTLPLHGLTEFGRQRSNEQVYPSTSFGFPANRIAIADREDARFSRQQFSVQILSPEFSVVTNLSHVHPIAVAEGTRLLQHDSATVSFPFQLRIVDLVISFS